MDLLELIKETDKDIAIKINQFNNIYDDELADILILEITALTKKNNYYYKKLKEEISV